MNSLKRFALMPLMVVIFYHLQALAASHPSNIDYGSTGDFIQSTATLNVSVNESQGNSLPVVIDDYFTATVNDVVTLPLASLLQNDTDAEGESLSVLFIDDWTNGVATIDEGAAVVLFTPDTNFVGQAQFTYVVTDGNDGGDNALMSAGFVFIEFENSVPNDIDAPLITIQGYLNNGTINLSVGDTFSVPAATAADDIDGTVAVVIESDVDANVAGAYTVTYSATDAAGNMSEEVLHVVVYAGEAPPLEITGLDNPLFDSPENTYTSLWESIVGSDGMPPISDRSRVDNASSLFFTDRSYLVAAARNYTVTGDIIWLNRAIAIANNHLNLRDDIYASNGGDVFTGEQVGYRSAPKIILDNSAVVAAVWSHDFTDRAANGNEAVDGRRVQVLQNGRVLSALAEVVLAFYTHSPSGDYVAPEGAQAGILSGSYVEVIETLLVEINRTARLFDGQWQQDITGLDLSGDSNNGLWNVAGSYFYDKRLNLSSEGIDIDGIVPFNQASGMLQARLVLARFSNLDPLAVEHFQRWAQHHESVYASDDPLRANPGLSGDHFGYDEVIGAYDWPYVTYQTRGEDVDHVIITLESYMTAYRLSLISRQTIRDLFRSMETVYIEGASDHYDRIFEFDARYGSFRALPGVINWLSDGTHLQRLFAQLINTNRPSGSLHIRDYEAIMAYYGTEQLSIFPAPASYIDVPDQSVNVNGYFDWVVPDSLFSTLDSSSLSVSASLSGGGTLPEWLDYSESSRHFTGIPSETDAEELAIRLMAVDGTGASILADFTLTVVALEDRQWMRCALEGVNCVVPYVTIVRYGSGDTYYEREVTGAIACSYRVFGDPIPGVAKACDYQIQIGETPTENQWPVVASVAQYQSVTVGATADWSISNELFIDPDNDVLVITATTADGRALPEWLSYDEGSQRFTGAPSEADVGVLIIRLLANDGNGGTVTTDFRLIVMAANEGQWTFCSLEQGICTVPYATTVRYGANGAYYQQEVSESVACNNKVFGDPIFRTTKSCEYQVIEGEVPTENQLPIVAGIVQDQSVVVNSLFDWTMPSDLFTDPDDDPLVISASLSDGGLLPEWLSFNELSHRFTGIPSSINVGSLSIHLIATDSSGGVATTTFSLTVSDAEEDLWIYCGPEGGVCSVPYAATVRYGANGDYYQREVSGSIVCNNTLFGDPAIGIYKSCEYQMISGGVPIQNQPPLVNGTVLTQQASAGSLFDWVVPNSLFTDPDGDALTVIASQPNGAALPSWLDYDSTTWHFTGVPTTVDVGPVVIRLMAIDGNGGSAITDLTLDVTESEWIRCASEWGTCSVPYTTMVRYGANGQYIELEVSEAIDCTNDVFGDPIEGVFKACVYQAQVTTGNQPPTVNSNVSTQTVTSGELFDWAIPGDLFRDPENDALIITASLSSGAALPAWLSYDAPNLRLTGWPTSTDVGVLMIRLTAVDINGGSAETVFELSVIDASTAPVPVSSVRQYTFNHSLWQHNFYTNAVTGYWVGELATASGNSYAWNGKFGQPDYHTQGYDEDPRLGPTPELGSTNSADVYPSENTHFRDIDIDNIIIMPPNFIQGDSPVVAPIDIEYAQRVIDYVADEGESGGQQSEAIVYIYEHWQEAPTFPLNTAQWLDYHEITTGSYHQWFINYQNALIASRPAIDFRMIPVGPIIADILQDGPLSLSGLSFSDLYEDEAPHGRPNVYFLAGLITYQAMYAQVASNAYTPPVNNVDGVSAEIADNYVALNSFVWQRLNYYQSNGVRIWP